MSNCRPRSPYPQLKNTTAMRLPDDILLVEDEPAIVDFMRRVLLRVGYRVRVATTGTQALAALSRFRGGTFCLASIIVPLPCRGRRFRLI